MDVRRLELLVALSRWGSMREVADELGVTTSTVSQQLAALARDVGVDLLRPDGRRVRLTPAGRRLADHAVGILAAVDAARADLDPATEPAGAVRVGGFATAVRRDLLPVVRTLEAEHPQVRLLISEFEPGEALAALLADDIDLALVYDYTLAPLTLDPVLAARELWWTDWALAVADTHAPPAASADSPAVFADHRDEAWIVNSRNTADEEVVTTIASMAGFRPRIEHRVDSLELVEDLVGEGLAVGMLPADQPPAPGVRLLPLSNPPARLRAMAVTRAGREVWPPLALVLGLLGQGVR